MSRKIYIIACEPSGDFLGAALLKQLKTLDLDIFIIGGTLMEEQGFKSMLDISELAVCGIIELIPHLRKINQLIKKTIEDIEQKKTDILLTIDSPGFNFRVARLIKKRNKKIKLIHFVAPSVWAWRPKRAKKMAKIYNKLLTLFDFEHQYFEKYGLETHFIGHPAIEYFEEFNEKNKENFILLMPGSRQQEIKLLLPIFLKSVENYDQKKIIIPTLPHLIPQIKSIIKDSEIGIETDENTKRNLFRNAKFAIVSSGTATLQLALSNCPMIVCYKLSNFTYKLLKFIVKTRYISLVNIILNEKIVPELIQENCTPENISKAILDCQLQNFGKLRERLKNNNNQPSILAADIIYGK